jgi:RNA polymerase sigma factor (sigma-70 family)
MRAEIRAARFESVFRTAYPRVLAYALRRADNRQEAEEATAETFLIAWRRLDDVPTDSVPWLFGVARKVLANQRRSARRREAMGPHASLDAAEKAVDPTTATDDLVADREAFIAAFASLDERDREVLALTAWEGLRPREGAVVLECTATAFSIRLHRARRRLMKELRATGHSPSEEYRDKNRSQPGTAEAR